MKYLEHGWRKAGVEYYESVLKVWKRRAANQEWWEKFDIAWDTYLEETGSGVRWRKKTSEGGNTLGDLADAAEEHAVHHFSFPGDEGFEADREWQDGGSRKDGNVDSGSEEDEDDMGGGDSGSGSEVDDELDDYEKESQVPLRKKVLNKRRIEESDEEELETPPPKRGTKGAKVSISGGRKKSRRAYEEGENDE